MELKGRIVCTLLLILLLLLGRPGFSRGRRHVKLNTTTGSEIYDIDYRGPETHTYIPPPNRVGNRPKIHHQTTMAPRNSKRRNVRKIGFKKN